MIEVNNLAKTYTIKRPGPGIFGIFRADIKRVEALKGVSFSIAAGEVVGILGANGAGKSTTIKILTGVLTASSGTVSVNGYYPPDRKKDFLSSIGLVMGNRSSLIYDLPIRDSFRYLRGIYGITASDFDQDINNLLERLNIKDLLDTPVRKLSLGQRKKAEIVAAILHQPQILFLDEPTIGLDVKSKKEILTFIKTLANDFGTTIIFTSHDLNDVEKLCPRIIYMDSGRIIYDGPTENFGSQADVRKVHLVLEQPLKDVQVLDSFNSTKTDDYNYEFILDKTEVRNLMQSLESEAVNEFFVQKVTLEDSVLDYVESN